MAAIKINGIDQIMADVNRRGSQLRPIIEEALRNSAEVVHEQLLGEEATTFVDPSGELGETITLSNPWHHGNASGIYVHFEGEYTGRRGSPRRAGLVAAMVEHKHRNPWMKRSMANSKKRVNSIIREALGRRSSIYSDWGGL